MVNKKQTNTLVELRVTRNFSLNKNYAACH